MARVQGVFSVEHGPAASCVVRMWCPCVGVCTQPGTCVDGRGYGEVYVVGLCVHKWMLVCLCVRACVYTHLYMTSRVRMCRTGPGLVTKYVHRSG